jgi:hypothetical protein
VPVAGKLRVLSRKFIIHCFHFQRREVNPLIANRAAPDKPLPLPPSSDQWLVNAVGVAVKLKLEVDPIHPMRATRMGASRSVIMDMRRGHGAESTFTVEAIKRFQVGGRTL